jgi:hypothetical protein
MKACLDNAEGRLNVLVYGLKTHIYRTSYKKHDPFFERHGLTTIYF